MSQHMRLWYLSQMRKSAFFKCQYWRIEWVKRFKFCSMSSSTGIRSLCGRAVKVLSSLCRWAGSPEPKLLYQNRLCWPNIRLLYECSCTCTLLSRLCTFPIFGIRLFSYWAALKLAITALVDNVTPDQAEHSYL